MIIYNFKNILNMLYHPNSPYYRQFLTASGRVKKNKPEGGP